MTTPATPPADATATPSAATTPAPAAGAAPDTTLTGTGAPPVVPPAKASETPPAAPETYSLKLPEGSRLDPSRVESIASLAKERGLSNEAAQEILTREHEAVQQYASAQETVLEKEKERWLTDLRADKEIGGDHLNKKVEQASRVVKKFGTPEFNKALNDTGLGNHPELVRVFARIADAMGEDNLVLPGAAPSGPASLRDLFYPPKQ